MGDTAVNETVWFSRLNPNGNVAICGLLDGGAGGYFFYEVSPLGNVIHYHDTNYIPLYPYTFISYNTGNYALLTELNYTYLTNSFTIDTNLITLLQDIRLESTSSEKVLPGNRVLLWGIERDSYTDTVTGLPVFYDAIELVEVNEAGNYTELYTYVPPDTPEFYQGFKTIDYVDTNYVYTAMNYDHNFSLINDVRSEYEVFCLKSNGEERWRRRFGGDAHYEVTSVLATKIQTVLFY